MHETDVKEVFKAKVRYLGKTDEILLINGKTYDVISIEKDWYRIWCEVLEDDYLFPPEKFVVIES